MDMSVNSLAIFAADAPQSNNFMLFAMLGIGVLFYVMLIRPENQKRKNQSLMQDSLKKNDKIVTVGGIYGTVVNAQQGSDDVTVRIDESTRIRVQRSCVVRLNDDETSKNKEPSTVDN